MAPPPPSARNGLRVLSLVVRDPRTPWPARVVVALTLAYALSPLDLVPDFTPVLGLLDDVVLAPLGVRLALRLAPRAGVDDARQRARQEVALSGRRWTGALPVVLGPDWRRSRGGCCAEPDRTAPEGVPVKRRRDESARILNKSSQSLQDRKRLLTRCG